LDVTRESSTAQNFRKWQDRPSASKLSSLPKPVKLTNFVLQIWEELNVTIGNTKTFDQVKNKKANLMQKASSKSMSVIDVLKDDIVKLEGGKLINSLKIQE